MQESITVQPEWEAITGGITHASLEFEEVTETIFIVKQNGRNQHSAQTAHTLGKLENTYALPLGDKILT